jgi:hypothetical protein
LWESEYLARDAEKQWKHSEAVEAKRHQKSAVQKCEIDLQIGSQRQEEYGAVDL